MMAPRALLVSHKAKDKSDKGKALNAWITANTCYIFDILLYYICICTYATSHKDTMAFFTVSALGCLCMRAKKNASTRTASLCAKAEEEPL